MSIDRRTFLQLLSTGALSAAFPPSIARALSIPAHNQTGTINDVEHIVIMMQENRSFDHYYGTLRGVRPPIPIVTTCGPAGSATTGQVAVRWLTTQRPATVG
jgi:phospholipase C